eukprot:7378921-Prymnesium_polylepis.2
MPHAPLSGLQRSSPSPDKANGAAEGLHRPDGEEEEVTAQASPGSCLSSICHRTEATTTQPSARAHVCSRVLSAPRHHSASQARSAHAASVHAPRAGPSVGRIDRRINGRHGTANGISVR